MPIVLNPSSEEANELRKWEQHHTRFAITADGDSKPGNPYVYRAYPKMLYKAQQYVNGQIKCLVPPPQAHEFLSMDQYERAVLLAETFNQSCYCKVGNEQERDQKFAQGWRESIADALAYHEGLEQDIAKAAAEAAHTAQRMTAQAQAELATVAQETHQHVTDVTGASRRTRGRPKRAKPVSATVVEDDR